MLNLEELKEIFFNDMNYFLLYVPDVYGNMKNMVSKITAFNVFDGVFLEDFLEYFFIEDAVDEIKRQLELKVA